MGTRILCGLLLAAALLLPGVPAESVATITLSGSAQAGLSISAGSVDMRANTSGAVNQLAAPDTENFVDTIDFGDLSTGDGTPAVSSCSVRVRSNCPYTVVVSRSRFQATNLHCFGRDVSGEHDGGSFITVSAGDIRATGSFADASNSKLGAKFVQGTKLSQLSSGPVAKTSDVLISGKRTAVGGTRNSTDNCLEVPLSFSCPTGTDIGPVHSGKGSFAATIQMEIFSEV
jgi:hypothetical protein